MNDQFRDNNDEIEEPYIDVKSVQLSQKCPTKSSPRVRRGDEPWIDTSRRAYSTYAELSDKLGQYELVPLTVGRRRQDVGDGAVDWGLLLGRRPLYVAVEPCVTRQLEALVLRSEGTHGLIRPNRPGA